ncbi:MAG: TolC family protein [Pseudomonadota bacterium]
MLRLPILLPGMRHGMLFLLAASCLAFSGCANFSPDGGLDAVSSLTQARTGHAIQRDDLAEPVTHTQATVSQMLIQPLDVDSAVKIALRNNQGLQAALANLGVAEADLVQAGRIKNPGFSFGRMRNGDEIEIERSIMFDLLGLLTMPIRRGIEKNRFEQTVVQTAAQAVQLAADTRRAYFNAIAAQQSAQYLVQVQSAAEAGAELGQRMAKAGNWSQLDQAREQVFYADATAQVLRAQHHASTTREQLTRLLGLANGNEIKLPDRLPDLPKSPADIGQLEAQAITQRLDIQLAKYDVAATARALGLSQASGFINVLDAGYVNQSNSGKARANGYEVSLELPIFDWGRARNAKAKALYTQALHHSADIALRAGSDVREAYSAYHTSYQLARHYRDEVVPLRKTISDEVLLRYNGMLTGVFELLADAREQIHSVNAAIEAQRDFWIADTGLRNAVNGGGTDRIDDFASLPASSSAQQEN